MKKNFEYTREQNLLLKAIEQAVEDLKAARIFFNYVDDPRLVDFAIYEEEAAKAKYGYLILQAKQKGLEVKCNYYLSEESQVG